jgi:hypothetical protein
VSRIQIHKNPHPDTVIGKKKYWLKHILPAEKIETKKRKFKNSMSMLRQSMDAPLDFGNMLNQDQP